MKHVATLAGAFLLYLALAGGFGAEQLVSAAVLAVVAVGAAAVIRRVAERPIRFPPGHLAAWTRAIARLPGDTLRIGGVLAAVAIRGGSPGRGVSSRFRYGVRDDPHERGRRATAVLAGSLTPDTFVLYVEPGSSEAVCHRLLATPVPVRPDWLA